MNTTKLMNLSSFKYLVPGALIAVSGFAQAQVDTFDFSDEDLLLAVQALSGTGASQNLFLKLGNTVTIKNTPNQGVIANIGTDMSNTYGSDWFTRTNLRFGVIGNRSNLAPTIDPGVPPQEPGRTLYVSIATSSAGAATLRGQLGSSALSQICTRYAGLRTVLTQADPNTIDDFFTALPSGATILDETSQPVSWLNSWSKWNPENGASFVSLTPNVETAFGTGSEVLVDVQRMIPSAPTTYITTVGISSSGDVRLFTSAPASGYAAWIIRTFAGGALALADRDPSDDPEQDGIENALEFVLNGDPTVNNQSILPTLDASGLNFVFNFTRRADSAGDTDQIFEYSTDLADWTTNAPISIPTMPGTVGSVTVGASTGTAPDQVQEVTVTIPKGSNTKLFGRLKAVK